MLREYSKFRIESNSYFSILFDSKRALTTDDFWDNYNYSIPLEISNNSSTIRFDSIRNEKNTIRTALPAKVIRSEVYEKRHTYFLSQKWKIERGMDDSSSENENRELTSV